MSKKYDYTRPFAYRSYKIRDICWLYADKKLHKDTVISWIKLGQLNAFMHGNAYYVYGADLKEFLKNKSLAQQDSYAFEELRCWKGGHVSVPKNNVITKLIPGNNKVLVAFADCPKCGMQMRRVYSTNDLPKIMECFTVKQNDVLELCDSATSFGKADIGSNDKTLPFEVDNKNISTTFNKTYVRGNNNSTSLDKTLNKSEQLNLFNFPEET